MLEKAGSKKAASQWEGMSIGVDNGVNCQWGLGCVARATERPSRDATLALAAACLCIPQRVAKFSQFPFIAFSKPRTRIYTVEATIAYV